MPCTTVPVGERLARQRDQALKDLAAGLRAGSITVKIDRRTGALAFRGWREAFGMRDLCAYRRLLAAGSVELRTAVARAEAQAGRRLNPEALAAGIHSHDGGETWGAD